MAVGPRLSGSVAGLQGFGAASGDRPRFAQLMFRCLLSDLLEIRVDRARGNEDSGSVKTQRRWKDAAALKRRSGAEGNDLHGTPYSEW